MFPETHANLLIVKQTGKRRNEYISMIIHEFTKESPPYSFARIAADLQCFAFLGFDSIFPYALSLEFDILSSA